MTTVDDLYPKLDEAVRKLAVLEGELSTNEAVSAEQRAKLSDITSRLKEVVTGFDLAKAPMPATKQAPPRGANAGPKYPAVEVALADLGKDLYAILRRVSYAMSDAEIDDDEIDRFKEEVKSSSNPVAATKSWVTVTDR